MFELSKKIKNPVPSINYPEWLQKKIKENDSKYLQKNIDSFF